MDAVINYTIDDGTNLSKTIDEQLEMLKTEGFDEENNVKLKEALADLELKEKAQNKAVIETEKKTAAQIKLVKNTHSLIKRLRDTARGAYQDDPKKLKQFKVDDTIPKGSGKLSSLCEYLAPIVEEERVILVKNGFMNRDFEAMAVASEKVTNAGHEKKAKLSLQKAATIARNNAAVLAKNQIKKIRRFIKARFAERPEIAVLFEPVSKGRGAASSEEEKPVENAAKNEEAKK